MKKWVDYQLKNQVRNWDWDKRVYKLDNISDVLGDAFDAVVSGIDDGSIPTKFENVFFNKDYIARTAASTNGDVTENDFRTWLLEYADLMSGHGHSYTTNFGDHTEQINKKFAEFYKLKPETVSARIQIEKPGQYFVVHMDRQRYQKWTLDEEVVYEKVRDQHAHDIFITFLTDQQLGQNFSFGLNSINWSKGDTFTWEHQSIPHYTSNVGYHTNYILVVTGEKLDKE